MKSYGIPPSIIDMVQNFYDGSRCAVRNGGKVSDHHGNTSGMCLVTVDLCPGSGLGDDRGTSGTDTDDTHLTDELEGSTDMWLRDLDFADGIAQLDNYWKFVKDDQGPNRQSIERSGKGGA